MDALSASLLVLFSLFNPSQQGSLYAKKESINAEELCTQVEDKICVIVHLNMSVFLDESLSVPVCKTNLKKKNYIGETTSDRSGQANETTVSVAYENDDGCEAVFSYRGHHVVANIETDENRIFILEPCSNGTEHKYFKGCHVLKEEDVEMFENEEEEGEEDDQENRHVGEESDRTTELLRQKGINDQSTVVTYTVKIYYTQEFKDDTPDVPLFLDQVIAETNQGYIDSNIPIRVKQYGSAEMVTIKESDSSTMLNALRNYKDSYCWVRRTADAAALISLTMDGCGRGNYNQWSKGISFSVAKKSCSLGYYSFGHELGHNIGANHNRADAGDHVAYDYGYGKGFGPDLRTIMGYSEEGHKKRVNYWSSQKVEYKSMTTGSSTEDNARVLTENRFAFAAVGDESGDCSSKVGCNTGGNSCCTSDNPCGRGEGDCDTGEGECQTGLICGSNNCPDKTIHGFGAPSLTDDCCCEPGVDDDCSE